MGAGAGRSSRNLLDLGFAVRRCDLPAVDEVFELLLVLIRVAVGLVAKHATLLDEILEGGVGVA